MEMPITLSVDKKAGFLLFPQARRKRPDLYTVIHSFNGYPQSCGNFKPCPRGQIEIDKVGITVEKGWALWKKRTYTQLFENSLCISPVDERKKEGIVREMHSFS